MKNILASLLLVICLSGVVLANDVISKDHQIILKNTKHAYGPKTEWIPSEAQTAKALVAIKQFLINENPYSGPFNDQRAIILNRLSDYRVQFIGILIDGQQMIHCNFFPKSGDFNYAKNAYVFVFDGGTSFWRIDCDITNNVCLNFEVNGEA